MAQIKKKGKSFLEKKYCSVGHFTSVLTTAREIPERKWKHPDNMCQLIFLKICPQKQKQSQINPLCIYLLGMSSYID